MVSELPITAYRLRGVAEMDLEPAPHRRAWIDATPSRFAARCLPVLMANQAGWHLRLRHSLRVVWSGEPGADSLRLLYTSGTRPFPATSLFGHGILTFHIPFLFRTPPGYNLLARGPANLPKDGAAALEGLIEADWAVATFTMNWQITRSEHVVEFAVGEPICFVVPQARGELERFTPRTEDLDAEPELHAQLRAWSASRTAFTAHRRLFGGPPPGQPWQKHYFQGTSPGGAAATEHQRKLRLERFSDP